MSYLADILITHKPGRTDLFKKSFQSLLENTNTNSVRLHLVIDGRSNLLELKEIIDCCQHVLFHQENLGLAPSLNQALNHIQQLNEYFEHPTHGDLTQVADFICYNQDDLLYSANWLEKLTKNFIIHERMYKLVFASGVECPEHTLQKDLGNGLLLKPWIRAAQMFAPRKNWLEMLPIPRYDCETKQVRRKPDNGIGSSVDWHFIRNHPKSVDRSGRTCLVIPGLVQHLGYQQSTWLKKDLPETERDKEIIGKALNKL